MLPDGQKGELVLTSLMKQALPIIRYRTRTCWARRARTEPINNASQARLLAGYIKDLIGISFSVDVQTPGALARSTGKSVRVRDLRTVGPSSAASM